MSHSETPIRILRHNDTEYEAAPSLDSGYLLEFFIGIILAHYRAFISERLLETVMQPGIVDLHAYVNAAAPIKRG